MKRIDLKEFARQELENWPLARANYEALDHLETRTVNVDGTPVRLQFNPARAVSSQARLDARSLAARPCFLCAANRPAEQRSIDFYGKYQLLLNPFPITPLHFTLAATEHRVQRMDNTALNDFLTLAHDMEGYTLLFNGAKAGASAPDHFHFQVTCTDYYHLPLERSTPLIPRRVWTADDPAALRRAWNGTGLDDTLCNFFARYEDGCWTLVVFPRRAHRPSQYYDGSLLVSPGAIDMTGTLILTRESDFDRLTAADIRDIYRQVSMP